MPMPREGSSMCPIFDALIPGSDIFPARLEILGPSATVQTATWRKAKTHLGRKFLAHKRHPNRALNHGWPVPSAPSAHKQPQRATCLLQIFVSFLGGVFLLRLFCPSLRRLMP